MLRTRGVSDHRLLLPVTYPSFCRVSPVSAARSASDGLGFFSSKAISTANPRSMLWM
ncbi:Uncharacterised protein [Mycobacteroides abscessus subsp. abscessus]|nr:Uncharacterised protein [Mycobacteroides abscessus subsp. abscessus]